MANREKLIDPEDLIRHKDGRIDLFNTILARKDPNAQVPVLSDTKPRHGTTSSHPYHRPEPTSQSSGPSLTKRHHTETPTSANSIVKGSWDGSAGSIKASDSTKNASSSSERKKSSSMPTVGTAETAKPNEATSGKRPSFQTTFIGYVNDPSSIPKDIQYWHDDNHLILRDAYPKANVHMLVLPRQRIDKITKLSGPSGIIIVEDLVNRANWLLERLKKESPKLEFKIGFHVIPSILYDQTRPHRQLHLHVISQDFCSAALKNKKHWNSFTTLFFISPEHVIDTLREKGSFSLTSNEASRYESELKRPLKCNQCDYMPNNMPMLKEHLQQHFSSKSK
ncbi:hypothetical protein BGX26_002701 [Mortierella sp. AD094]|nr:hypothetical protein BGX26_002701 [Mortierella sp. AD094]